MKLEFVIKDLILNNKIKTQTELTKVLSDKGYMTTQSNISRILKKLNTVKVVDDAKNSYYMIQPRPLELSAAVKTLVTIVKSNGVEIIIKTRGGTAGVVARIIDERNMDNVIGSIAGYDTIIVLVEDIKLINVTLEKIRSMFFNK